MKHVLRVLNHNGDEEVPWTEEDQKAARGKFRELAKTHAFFKMTGKEGEQIRKFDPSAEEIIAHRPLVGG